MTWFLGKHHLIPDDKSARLTSSREIWQMPADPACKRCPIVRTTSTSE